MLCYSVFTFNLQCLFKNLIMIIIGIETCSWKTWGLVDDNHQNVSSLTISKFEAASYEVLASLHKFKYVHKIKYIINRGNTVFKHMDYVIFRVYFAAQVQGKIVTCDFPHYKHYFYELAMALNSFTLVGVPKICGLWRSEFCCLSQVKCIGNWCILL
jgi:hypothetical protein